MKALVSILEPRETGYRIAEVVADGDIFDVAPDLFWVDCSDQIVKDEYWYDPSDETIKAIPVPVVSDRPKTLDELVEELVMKKLQALSANTN